MYNLVALIPIAVILVFGLILTLGIRAIRS